MKLEVRIDGKVVVIQAEGTICVQILEEERVTHPVHKGEESQRSTCIVEEVFTPMLENRKESDQGTSEDVFTRLVELRRDLAKTANIPTYVVFKDSTLREMADKRPTNLEEFSTISGVGKTKLEKYGEIFLSVINQEVAA